MDKKKLAQLLKMEEGPKLDFKASLSLETESEKKELAKDVIAIANSSAGRGYIIFGVEDKTKVILGVDAAQYKEEQIQQIIYNRCDPPVPVSLELVDYRGKQLAVLTIYRSSQQPHQMLQNGAFYVRRGSTTDYARRNEIARLFQQNGLMTYETVVLQHVGMNELDENEIQRYFLSLHADIGGRNEILLEAMGIAGRGDDGEAFHPTIGGLLLFGKNPVLYLPHVYIRVIHEEEEKVFYGNIVRMMENTIAYIKELLHDTRYPIEAVEEAIANALIHRDYLDMSGGITVEIGSHSIKISNPGALSAEDGEFDFPKEGSVERRNSWLYQRLLILDNKKSLVRHGIGASRIRQAFSDPGAVKFQNIGSKNTFTVVLPRA